MIDEDVLLEYENLEYFRKTCKIVKDQFLKILSTDILNITTKDPIRINLNKGNVRFRDDIICHLNEIYSRYGFSFKSDTETCGINLYYDEKYIDEIRDEIFVYDFVNFMGVHGGEYLKGIYYDDFRFNRFFELLDTVIHERKNSKK